MILYKGLLLLWHMILGFLNNAIARLLLRLNNVDYSTLKSIGIPYVMVARGGHMRIGMNFTMNNNLRGNPIGRYQRCSFFVDKGAELVIGDNVGFSQVAIACHKSISVGNYVKIGGGVCIYDTDFHSLDPYIRQNPLLDMREKAKASVRIDDNAFIGAHSTILKGVHIGQNSVVGACSVVTKNVPANEIWAGNPARFIKKLLL